MSAEKARVGGWRQAIMLMHKVAELAEKHPEISAPRITFGGYQNDGITYTLYGFESYYDYKQSRQERADARRLLIEGQFNLLTAWWGEDLEWVTNSPLPAEGAEYTRTYHRDNFELTAVVSGVQVKIVTQREYIGEKVQSLDSGPIIDDNGDGTMQAVRTHVTTWQPNIHLTALARPGFAIASTTSKELTA